ncbi:hypothetical protein I302_103373 [Kwoniella bestiolae CBS 10118]|uniref:Uncharacterized protein n=1 Tax=Kwoniella bestiolae CBS 10118 TaxID=1296100 RepID=A0A1B9G871_9TREE|nr:hypothetical protein I302_02074 [Kwoniella bestiolae CBS 10118]OCF27234.1 hypothetical protein I302_02074 [Kwoniella bestiolae CBS 10118]
MSQPGDDDFNAVLARIARERAGRSESGTTNTGGGNTNTAATSNVGDNANTNTGATTNASSNSNTNAADTSKAGLVEREIREQSEQGRLNQTVYSELPDLNKILLNVDVQYSIGLSTAAEGIPY